jgi:hypothetical protein
VSTIALAIPHTPWVPARAESMERLLDALGIGGLQEPGFPVDHFCVFTERAANHVWAESMWRWLHSTGADWCLQLQDDVMVAQCFWPAIRAMLGALPPEADVVGLTSVHPMTPEIARRGHRWHRTPGNLVGWAYALRRDALGAFLEDRARLPEGFRVQNEDEQIAIWTQRSGRSVWHPVPAIVDHDTSIPSSYGNDHHSHRRPRVTWRTFDEREICDVDWWRPSGTPEMLPMPDHQLCWMCGDRPVLARSERTGCGICHECAIEALVKSGGGACSFCGRRRPLRGSSVTGASICGMCLHETLGSILSAFDLRPTNGALAPSEEDFS